MKRVVFFSILLLGFYLRLTGITWGIPTQEFPSQALHPDEVWAMQVLQEVSIELGDFNPDEGHREGTFAYFLWSGTAYFLKVAGIIAATPHPQQPYDESYARVLLAGRLLVVMFDLLCAVFIFFAVHVATRNFNSAILSLLVFLITPFEVIHAHYMRTHIIANFFIAFVIYLSFRLYNEDKKKLFFLTGFSTGLGFATRYPTLAVIVVPGFVYCWNENIVRNVISRNFASIWRSVVSFRWWIFAFGLAAGTFVGLPFLFLDFESARPHLMTQASYIATDEFRFSDILNLSRVWTYIRYLIPYGTLPGLWLLYYASTIYLLFRPKVYRYFMPLLIFIISYLYSMAKGYFALAVFIRAALPLFPAFAICFGLAYWDISARLEGKKFYRSVLHLCIASIVSLSIFYDLAYDSAMRHDPRVELAKYLHQNWKRDSVRIGLYNHSLNYFVVKPVLVASKHPSVRFLEEDSFHDAAKGVDFIILSAFEHEDYAVYHERQNWLRHSAKFTHVIDFSPNLVFAGINFNFPRNPHDLMYPIPAMDLWKVRDATH